MSNEDPKMVAMHFFVADWISGTRSLTCQQRGIYIDLLSFSQSYNGQGLPDSLEDLCRLVLPFEPDIQKSEHLRADLIYVINIKFKKIDGRFFNDRQHSEFIKSKELSKARSRARSKNKFDTLLLQQTDDKPYKDKYKSKYNNEDIFNNIWSKLLVRKGSKQKTFEKWCKIKDDVDQQTLIDTFNHLCSNTDDPQFVPHFVTWLNQARWNDEIVFNQKQFMTKHNIKGIYLRSEGNHHFFETRESFGVVKWIYDNNGKLIDEKDINGKKEKEETSKTTLKIASI